jgi:hypothetical protein
MCSMCNGETIEESFAFLGDTIDRVGWALQGVDAGSPGRSWAYTIGLIESYDHPELIVTGVDLAVAERMLNTMSKQVARGDRYEPGEVVEFGNGDVVARILGVHVSHFHTDRFAMWFGYYASLGRLPGQPLFRLAALLDPRYCDMHQRGTDWLDHPVQTRRTSDRARRRPKKRRR